MQNKISRPALLCLIFLVMVAIALTIFTYQAYRAGLVRSQIAGGPGSVAALPKGQWIDFLQPQPIGDPFQQPPMISHVAAIDLDQDGLLDAVVCDCQAHSVRWIRQHPAGRFIEQALANDLIAPAHAEAVDFDADGDLDLAVAVLGMLFPNNDPIGSVILLENDGHMQFTKRIVAEKIARVSDVRTGDLDGDGDMDLAVAQFGYDDGETRWIENLGDWQFRSHPLQSLSGPIHCPICDIDQDGDLDIVVLVSQQWEEIYVFRNDGRGQFQPVRVFDSDNEDFGSSSIHLVDLDQDGDTDILYTNGDGFDYIPPLPRHWHGVQWLENLGDVQFRYHRIADVPGAVNARADDLDGDGDLDLYVASAYNYWENPAAQSLIWLENDGRMRFRPRDITNRPTHIQGLDLGDFDGDRRLDVITGGLHTYEPRSRMERITLWMNRWPEPPRR